jgi:hypothetical protein
MAERASDQEDYSFDLHLTIILDLLLEPTGLSDTGTQLVRTIDVFLQCHCLDFGYELILGSHFRAHCVV